MSALTNAYIFLILAIVAEVIGTLCLRETEGFTKIIPSLITAISYAASFYWLSFTLDEIPINILLRYKVKPIGIKTTTPVIK